MSSKRAALSRSSCTGMTLFYVLSFDGVSVPWIDLERAQTITSIIGSAPACSLTRTWTLNPDKAVFEAWIAFSGRLFFSLKWARTTVFNAS